MKCIGVKFGKLVLTENVMGFFQKKVTKFGSCAQINCPKEFLGKTVYVVVCKDKTRLSRQGAG